MAPSEKLLDFFRREFETEEASGFARLKRAPDSRVAKGLQFYASLSAEDKVAFREYCVHEAHAGYGSVLGLPLPRIEDRGRSVLGRWESAFRQDNLWTIKSVPLLRAAVQQYKIDLHRGVQSAVTKEHFEYACSIRSVKAPELRKRARSALKPLGYRRVDELGYYCCEKGDRRFRVHLDFGARDAQMRYFVERREFVVADIHQPLSVCFERALGFGFGHWNFIVEENVDDAFSLFTEVVAYSYELPDRILAAR